MSIQAVGWALEQDLPARPKLVLVSICNHASHTDGYCWLKAETISGEAACSPRAVFNFVGDLIRNGYLRKAPRKGDDGKQRANDYWILFDRSPEKWSSDRTTHHEENADEDDATQDVDEPYAPRASGEDSISQVPVPVELPAGACGPHASTCSRKNNEEPSESKPKEAMPSFAAPPRRYMPPPVEPQGAVADREAKQIFVFEGSRAYAEWAEEKRKSTGVAAWHLVTTKVVDGKARRGWYFPSLFPPKPTTTGPPTQPSTDTTSLMTREDDAAMADEWNAGRT